MFCSSQVAAETIVAEKDTGGKKQQQPKWPQKKEQQKRKHTEEKQQEHYIQAIIALHGEVTNKLSLRECRSISDITSCGSLVPGDYLN